MPKFKVAICGAGISGLCLAVALSRCQDIQVDIYETADRFKEIGAGVMIWSRTWRILEDLGLGSAFSKVAHAPPDGSMATGFDFRRSDQPQEGFCIHKMQMPYGCIRFYRVDFLDVFVHALPPNVAHFGMRLISYHQEAGNGEITLKFLDDTTAVCDVLIGCDGIKSSIRAQLFKEVSERSRDTEFLKFIDPVWTGTIAYRGLIPAERLPPFHRSITEPMMYCGKSKHVVSYSISQGSIVNVVTFASEPKKEGSPYEDKVWVTPCSQQELLDCYAQWEPEVEQLLSCIENPTRWAIHHLKPLPFYVDGNVVLLGSCNGSSPRQVLFPINDGLITKTDLGAGAGTAIEDAFILAALLEQVSLQRDPVKSIPYALEAYQRVRLPFANHVLKESYISGSMYEFDNDEFEENYDVLAPAIVSQWHWVDNPSPESERMRALDCFIELSS